MNEQSAVKFSGPMSDRFPFDVSPAALNVRSIGRPICRPGPGYRRRTEAMINLTNFAENWESFVRGYMQAHSLINSIQNPNQS